MVSLGRPLCCIVHVGTSELTSSALLGREGSSATFAIFCLRLSLLGARPGRVSFGWGCWGDRLVEGVVPRGLEDEGIWGRPCEADDC